MEKCKKCGSEKTATKLTPNSIHYAEIRCAVCGSWVGWLRNPSKAHTSRVKTMTPHDVCVFHGFGTEFCFFCLRERGQLGSKETLTVDHIMELNEVGDGGDRIGNTQVLCSACHKLKNWARLYVNWHISGKRVDGGEI